MKAGMIAIGAVLALAVGVGAWYLLRDKDDSAAMDAMAEAQSQAPKLTAAQREEAVRTRMAARQKLWHESTFAEVNKQAMAGDALAQLRLSEMYEDCVAYTQTMKTNFNMLGQMAIIESEIGARVTRMLRQRHALCAAAQAEKRPFAESANFWLHASAKQGDPVAEMRFISRNVPQLSVKQFDHFLSKTRASGYPDAMYGISSLLGKVGGKLTDDAQLTPLFDGGLAEHVWAIAACRRGLDCGEDSRLMEMACLSLFSCEHRDYETFLMKEIIPTTSKAEIDRLVGLIDQRVLAVQ